MGEGQSLGGPDVHPSNRGAGSDAYTEQQRVHNAIELLIKGMISCQGRDGGEAGTTISTKTARANLLGRLDSDGYNLLHCTSALGVSNATWALIREAGLDVDVEDANGNTPLHLACAHGHQMVVEVLLAAGSAQRPNHDGLMPLDIALQHSSRDETALVLVLD
eukprot:SAG31_NODE_7932_length_1561_cov_1.765390_2_plen_162_part_01